MADVRLLELRNTYKWGGGPDKTILLSAEQHDPSRIFVVVAYVRDIHDQDFAITQMAQEKNLLYYEIPESKKFDWTVIRAIRDIVIRHDINLIHGHDYKSDLFAYLVSRSFRHRQIAVIATAHGWALLGLKGNLYQKLDTLLMRQFDHLIAVSEKTKEKMVSAGVPSSKISVILNGIDTKTWHPPENRLGCRENLGIGEGDLVVGYVGRITSEKDLESWLWAASIVGKSFKNVRFFLVGDGRDGLLQRELQGLTRDLGIESQVRFLGYQKDLLSIYAAMDLFVLSSSRENLPNCVLEAMAMEVPVVTTDVIGNKNLVVDGKTGLVVPPGDSNALAQGILKMLEDKHMRKELGLNGRVHVESEFSFSKRLGCIESLYEKILNEQAIL